jgi:type IV secretory pathway VirB4 component
LLQASRNVKNALLFNVLSFMSDKLLTEGNTAASIDELYLFLTNLTAIEYIRNFMKRVRKKESAVILASQNLEDFNIEGIRELTKAAVLHSDPRFPLQRRQHRQAVLYRQPPA